MEFDIQIAHRVEDINREVWDGLYGQRPFGGYRWYRYGEAVLNDNVPLYIMLLRHGEPVAGATFWVRRREPLPVSGKLLRRCLELLFERRPLLVCQTPLADQSGLVLPAPPLRGVALQTIAQVVREEARAFHASFVLLLYLDDIRDCPDGFTGVQFLEPRTRLWIEWADFDEYLKSLSYSRRRNIRRHGSEAAALGIETHRRPVVLDDGTLDRAVDLIHNVEERHDAAPTPWARAMLKYASMVDAAWIEARIGDKLVGCGLVVGDGPHMEMKLLGLDYEVRYAYFQVVYEALRAAIERGARVLWGGCGAYELKRHLGFEVMDAHYDAFAGQGGALRWLGQLAKRMQGQVYREAASCDEGRA